METSIDIQREAIRVFDTEIAALQKMRDSLDDTFSKIVQEIVNCSGKIIITGMGKPGHIAKKLAATFSSLGTPSFFLHPAEAMHGDLGMVSRNDIVIAISYSGESEEIIRILTNIKMIGAKIIALSGNANSTLVRCSDMAQIFPPFEEACHLRLAPTSSTTVTLAYGDALAVTASEIYGFTPKKFGLLHPAGALGKKLIYRIKDIMVSGDQNPITTVTESLKNAVFIMSRKKMGMVSVVDSMHKLSGIITDGDLRRLFEKEVDIYKKNVGDVMTTSPFSFSADMMAVEALKIFKERNIRCAPVVDDNNIPVGCITVSTIIDKGIVL